MPTSDPRFSRLKTICADAGVSIDRVRRLHQERQAAGLPPLLVKWGSATLVQVHIWRDILDALPAASIRSRSPKRLPAAPAAPAPPVRVAEPAPAAIEPPVKRGRGRPRKQPLAASAGALAST